MLCKYLRPISFIQIQNLSKIYQLKDDNNINILNNFYLYLLLQKNYLQNLLQYNFDLYDNEYHLLKYFLFNMNLNYMNYLL